MVKEVANNAFALLLQNGRVQAMLLVMAAFGALSWYETEVKGWVLADLYEDLGIPNELVQEQMDERFIPIAERIEENRTRYDKALADIDAAVALLEAADQQQANAQAETLNVLTQISAQIEDQAQVLRKVLQPDKVFELSSASRFITPCFAGEDCTVLLVVRRSAGAEECVLVPEETRHGMISAVDFRSRRVSISPNSGAPVNVSNEFEALEITLVIPTFMPVGEADYRFSASYEGCPFQTESDPLIEQQSDPISLIIMEKLNEDD